jgi:phosphocarrier protein
MQTCDITIINKLGLHARAAAKLVQLTSQFSADIQLKTATKSADAKNIMSVLMLAAAYGCELSIQTNGEDEKEAMAQVCQLFADRFDEPE